MSKKDTDQDSWWADLQNNENYQNLLTKKEAEREKIRKALEEEEYEILGELAKAGFSINSVWDFVNTKNRYKKAIPILKKHLSNNNYSNKTKEGIYRSLAVNWRPDDETTDLLLDLFEKEEDVELRWVIGNTPSNIIKKEKHVKKALSILQDKSFGHARSELVHCYARYYKQDAIPALVEFLDDSELLTETIIALGKLKAIDAKEKIEVCVSHKEAWIRQKAKAALKKIA